MGADGTTAGTGAGAPSAGPGPPAPIAAPAIQRTGRRCLLTRGPGGGDDDERDDERDDARDDGPPTQIVLGADGADLLADLLHERSVADRLAEPEWRVAELAGNPADRGSDA